MGRIAAIVMLDGLFDGGEPGTGRGLPLSVGRRESGELHGLGGIRHRLGLPARDVEESA